MKLIFKNKLNVFLLISAILHLIFIFKNLNILDFNNILEKSRAERKSPEKGIKIILQDQKRQNLQVVTTEESRNKEAPKDAKFLSRENQTVNRQTIAKVVDSFNQGGGGSKGAAQRAKPKQQVFQEKRKKSPHGKVSLSDLSHDSLPEKRIDSMAMAAIQGIGSKGKGLSSNNDYIEDVPLGDMTLLNTAEFKFYGFYFRIRQQLEQYWGKTLREKANSLYKSGRRLAADQDKITSLTILLDPKGNIIEVAVKSTSGVKELDDAAVESFNRAGPFPNPPRDMVVGGIVKIEWGFVVKS
ncbi:MAG: energy transducer TonB [Bdellovibrio sp.]|nr:energy transducer TonB [Bdellovibrio sp.]